ncbi:MAG: DMT family transporter [Bdellovibrionales bacterium]|nr:DMT family transporter [Bdellovibrionales bacterium]
MKQWSAGQRWMAAAVLFFSLVHAAVKFLSHIPFFELVFFRALISLVICAYLLRSKGISLIGHNRRLLFARGLAGTCALTGYFYTLQAMPLATAVTVQYLSPIITLLIAGVLLGEKARAQQWLYFFTAFIGVLLVKGLDPRVSYLSLGVGISAAFFSALAYNFVRMLKDTDHALVVVFYFPLTTIPLVGPFAISGWVWPVGWDWLVVLVIGVGTQIAQVYMTKAYQAEPASRISLINYIGLIFALAIGWFGFSEAIPWLSVAGMALILTSVFLGTRGKAS